MAYVVFYIRNQPVRKHDMEEKMKEQAAEAPAIPAGMGLLRIVIENIWRKFGYYIFFFTVFIMYEVLLRLSSVKSIEFTGFFFSTVFNLILMSLFCYTMSFISRKPRDIASNVALSIATVFYISQIIYYNVFGTFYNPESMSNAGQIIEFWEVILKTAWGQIVYILLCIAPIPLYNLFVRKSTVISIEKKLRRLARMDAFRLRQRRLIKWCAIVSVYIVMLLAFIPFAKDSTTAYSMFFGQQSYEDSINRTGLLSTLQVDMLKVFIKEDMSGSLVVPAHNGDGQPDWEDPVHTPTGDDEHAAISPDGPDDTHGENGGEQPSIPPVPIEYGYNKMDIDFESLIADESKDSVIALHEYFAYVKPTRQNEYTGMFKDYNLIMFTAEAFSPFAVDPVLTPTLYKLVNDGFHFTNFYTPIWGVSTSDGEYVACTGLLPKSGVWSFSRSSENYMPFVMGNQLKNLGYETQAYHNHTYTYYGRDKSHPNMGYVYKGIGHGLELPKIRWPNSDLEMMEATIDEYINKQPFHTYYMTVSGHLEYNFGGNAMASRNKEAVADLPYSDACKAYIACNIELDKAMQYLLERLRAAGIADKTVIVLSSDHYPYGLMKEGFDGISEFLGHRVDQNFEMHRNNLIIYADGMQPVTVDAPCASLDIIPTISNLMGLEYDSRLLMGRDILSDSDPLVIFNNRNFITDKGYYTKNEGFVPNPGVEVDDDYCRFLIYAVDAKFTASARMLELNYYRKVFG